MTRKTRLLKNVSLLIDMSYTRNNRVESPTSHTPKFIKPSATSGNNESYTQTHIIYPKNITLCFACLVFLPNSHLFCFYPTRIYLFFGGFRSRPFYEKQNAFNNYCHFLERLKTRNTQISNCRGNLAQ